MVAPNGGRHGRSWHSTLPLTADELAQLQKLNEGLAQIHVVQFAQKEHGSNSLVELAKKNRGKHRYLNPLELDKDRGE